MCHTATILDNTHTSAVARMIPAKTLAKPWRTSIRYAAQPIAPIIPAAKYSLRGEPNRIAKADVPTKAANDCHPNPNVSGCTVIPLR